MYIWIRFKNASDCHTNLVKMELHDLKKVCKITLYFYLEVTYNIDIYT